MLNIHRRLIAIVSVIALVMLAGAALFMPASSSFAAQHGALTRGQVLLEQIKEATDSREDALSHRFVYPTGDLIPGAPSYQPKLVSKDVTTGAVQINEPVQTYDVLNPPPAFTPTTINAKLDSVNATPSWTHDEAYIVFASTMPSTITGDPAGKSHIWVAPAGGGAPIQLTSGAGNDLFPVLSPTNNFIAFVSDVAATGIHNLYVIPFNESATPTPIDVSTLVPLTVKQGGTTFSDIGRPAWSPSEDRLAFAGSVSGSGALQYHVYYLYVSTGGYLPLGSTTGSNPPGQFTAGQGTDTDVAWSSDGRYIAFASTSTGFSNTGLNVNPLLNQTSCVSGGATTDGTRGIFIISGAGTVPNTAGADLTATGGRVSNVGTVDGGPAWAVPLSKYDGFLAFHRRLPETRVADTGGTPVNTGNSHFQIIYSRIENNVTTGTLQTEAAGGTNVVNSSDSTDDGVNTTSNSYDDIYPTWSPQLKRLGIAYQSNRSITYNNPTTNAPLETAVNLAQNTNGLSANYNGVLVSEIENINPATLLRFNGSEVVHANAGFGAILPSTTDPTGSAVRFVAPGTIVTFTVRLSNRETGVDPENVFLQIKDPDSKYDDAQSLEHKLFATDNPALVSANQNDTDLKINTGFGTIFSNSQLYNNIVDTGVTNVGNNAFNGNRGAVGGLSDNTHDFGVGRGTTAANFRSWGPEYECQALDPLYYAKSRTAPDPRDPNLGHLNTLATDYYRPYYLAGLDDAFSHAAPQIGQPDPNDSNNTLPQNPGDSRSGFVKPVTWLKLVKLPTASQDTNGGILYSVSWLTPQSQSDFYLDVIAYDKAKNWRIYDNVWGFTTQPWVGDKDIMVVSDYALGQKFAASTLSGVANLRPTMYGDESYYTSIDTNLLPTAVYIWKQPTGSTVYQPTLYQISPVLNTTNPALNALGTGSYADSITYPPIANGVVTTDAPSHRYNIWRILSRGPVDQSVLMSYAPTFVRQPAVNDNGFVNAAATFPIAKKCVIWTTPFTGDLLVGPGTFGSPSTQAQVATFLNAGGRLFVSGQDAAATITLNGAINNTDATKDFLPKYLGARWTGSGSYNPVATPVAGRISRSALFNDGNPYRLDYFTVTPTSIVYGPPSSYADIVSNAGNEHTTVSPPFLSSMRSDGSMVDLTVDTGVAGVRLGANFVDGTMDTLTAIASTPTKAVHTDYTILGGSAGLVYYEDTSNFSRAVLASFDLGGFGIEYYKVTIGQADFYFAHNFRPSVMHNIVTYLRTGTVTGTITQNSGAGGGQVVPNATVYLVGNFNGTIPGMPAGRTVYSAMTDANGNYRIDGVESGTYDAVAYKPGFARATSPLATLVEGDNSSTISLNMTAVPPGAISGKVTNQSDGAPVEGATVTFNAQGTSPLSATTDANGNYTIQNVPGGAPPTGVAYTGVATKGTATSDPQTGNVISGQTATVNFTLPTSPAQVSGKVSDSNGPIVGATVTATPQGGGAALTATTDASGNYKITGIAPGTYSVTASAAGHFPSTVRQSISSGDALTLNFTLTIGTPTIVWGLIKGSALGGPVGGVNVSVEDSSNNVVSSFVSTATTKPAPVSGQVENYQIGLPAGTYHFVTDVTGVAPVTVVVGTSTVRQDITVPTGVVGGSITIQSTGAALGGATVNLLDATSGNVLATKTSGASLVTPPASTTITNAPPKENYYFEVQPNTSLEVSVSKSGYLSQTSATLAVTADSWTTQSFSMVVDSKHHYDAGLNFISVPYDYSALGWNGLFGSKPANRSTAFIWQPTLFSYIGDPSPPADQPRIGYGYWIKLTNPVDITVAGASPTTSTINVPLSPGWNMIGVPSISAVNVSSVTFANPVDPQTPVTFANASSSLYHLVSPTLYYYDTTQHQYLTTTSTGTLTPWQGYWIFAYQSCTIQLPTTGG